MRQKKSPPEVSSVLAQTLARSDLLGPKRLIEQGAELVYPTCMLMRSTFCIDYQTSLQQFKALLLLWCIYFLTDRLKNGDKNVEPVLCFGCKSENHLAFPGKAAGIVKPSYTPPKKMIELYCRLEIFNQMLYVSSAMYYVRYKTSFVGAFQKLLCI